MIDSRHPLPASRRARPLRWLAVLGFMAALAGCAGTPISNPDVTGSGSGITVYGTADAGVGRVRR